MKSANSHFIILILTVLLALPALATAANPKVTVQTNMGSVVIELFEKEAPESVANFRQYVEEGFYDGTIFHRVIGNFMIQGGGYDQSYVKKLTRAPIRNEAANGLSNKRGTVAMARTNNPHSATAQFFINVVDNKSLDYELGRNAGYAVFGQVVGGMETVDKIRMTPTGPGGPFRKDVPREPVIIEQVTINE